MERRRGTAVVFRRSTLPGGRPWPCTASTRIRVISCESVRCSPAARRRSDSFNSFGTYAPIKTPLRFAIRYSGLLQIVDKRVEASAVKRVDKPNSVFPLTGMAIIHLVSTLPSGSSSLPGNAAPLEARGRAARLSFPYLALHREEFTWPMPVTRHAGELLPHPFTHIPINRDWSALCCTCRSRKIGTRPLAGSLPCGVRTFLPDESERPPNALHWQGLLKV